MINIAEILKECPKGMELDCTMFDKAFFEGITNAIDFPIEIRIDNTYIIHLTKEGFWNNHVSAKCVIFPKGKTTWEGFQRPFKDGDIVATRNGIYIGIIKIENNMQRYAYVAINEINNLSKNIPYSFERFATEKEKEKLFNVIKANGYKWNEKTKTLEELVEPKFKVDDKIKLKGGDEFGIITEVADCFYTIKCKNNTHCWPIKKQDDWELVPNKLDITTLKPFDKVLVRDSNKHIWCASIFSNTWKNKYYCVGMWHNQCIPYEGNEHLLGTTDDCNDFYKTW